MRLHTSLLLIGSLLVALGGCRKSASTSVPDGADWTSYGRTNDEQRFSPLTSINEQNIGQLGLNSTNFADRLLSKHHVAVVPGVAFGNDATIRLSYATSLDVIKKGLDRLEEFCKTL